MIGTPRGHGMHQPFHLGTTSVLTSVTRTGTLVAEMASTQAIEPLEDRPREEDASTTKRQRQGPRHRLPRSIACNKRCHKSYEGPDRRTPNTARTPGSPSRPAQTPRTADRGRLTHLTGKATKAAPNNAIGNYLSKSPSFGFG
jgi:hypothetical protein